MQAPPQLRVEHAFDGFTVQLSSRRPLPAKRWAWFAVGIGAPLLLWGGWSRENPVALLGGLMLASAYLPTRGQLADPTERTELRVVGRRLKIVRDGRLDRALPLVQVGRARVNPGPELEILVAGEAPARLRMSLEPTEHAAWLADAIEGAARQARAQRGSAGEVPHSLVKLREG